jgi:predicted nucleic acid-binding protein
MIDFILVLVKGTGGLLVEAKARGFIPEVRPLLEKMKAEGYFLSPRLMNECLRRAGEAQIGSN